MVGKTDQQLSEVMYAVKGLQEAMREGCGRKVRRKKVLFRRLSAHQGAYPVGKRAIPP